MYHEAYKKNSDHLWPTYRYEPWLDLDSRVGRYSGDFMSQPYWVEEASMGEGDAIPSSHKNMRPTLSFAPLPYPTTPLRIGDYVADNLGEFMQGGTFFDDKPLTAAQWNSILRFYKHKAKKGTSAFELAQDSVKRLVRRTYSQWAQTRKVASYGYLQMTYIEAITSNVGYRPQSRPEDLSDEDVETPLVCGYAKKICEKRLRQESPLKQFDEPDWAIGFETNFYFFYHRYNKTPTYPGEVFRDIKLFDPSSK